MGGRIGVDEAGRGPVIGSMFVAAVGVPDPAIVPDDVADSKTLAPARRRDLADRLSADPRVSTAVVEVSADTIDAEAGDLLGLVVRAFAEAIDRLDRPGWRVTLDAGEADAGRFADRVERHLDVTGPVTAAVRADATEPIVSAASVIAKEHRERHVERLGERYGDVGSGYPADPTTRAFLAAHVEATGELPACARRCWQTSRDVLAAAEQSSLDGFVDTATGD
ncbi:MAG: ribonuclease HII [Halobacteriales archaeon]